MTARFPITQLNDILSKLFKKSAVLHKKIVKLRQNKFKYSKWDYFPQINASTLLVTCRRPKIKCKNKKYKIIEYNFFRFAKTKGLRPSGHPTLAARQGLAIKKPSPNPETAYTATIRQGSASPHPHPFGAHSLCSLRSAAASGVPLTALHSKNLLGIDFDTIHSGCCTNTCFVSMWHNYSPGSFIYRIAMIKNRITTPPLCHNITTTS